MAIQITPQVPAFTVAATWQHALPALFGERVVLRQLRPSDAAALLRTVSAPDVSRFISAPPPDVAAFERFITRSQSQQAAGTLAVFTLTLKGHDTPIGLFQLRALEPSFRTAEWGFAIGSTFWGTGLFEEAAELVLAFAFDTVGVHRLEARAAAKNGRGNRALQKLGAVAEGVLRQAFLCGGEYLDQVVYGLVAGDWRRSRRLGRTSRLHLVH